MADVEGGRRIRLVIAATGSFLTLLGLWLLMGAPTGGGFAFEDVWAGYIGTPLTLGDAIDTAAGWVGNSLMVAGLMVVLALLFLKPGRRWRARLAAQARPMWTSVVAAAAIAALLTAGLISALLELPDWYVQVGEYVGYWGFYGGLALAWAFWGVVFAIYWRGGDRYSQLVRMVRWLIAGTVLESLVAVPAHLLVGAHRDCWCARGSYAALVFGLFAATWLFGPGIVLLLMRERVRAQRLSGRICLRCGYDLRGNPLAACPECGAPQPGAGHASHPHRGPELPPAG